MTKYFVRLTVACFALLMSALPAFAQCPSNEVTTLGIAPANAPIRLAWEFPTGTAGTNFSVLVNGAIVKNFNAAELTKTPITGSTTCETFSGVIPGLAASATPYKVKLRAYVGSDPGAVGFVETAEKTLTVGLTVPFNFRIVLTPTVASNKLVGIDVAITGPDGSVVREFVPVANVTGRMDLSNQTIIQR